MPRFKLVIEYAGTRYSGWQIQKNARTVAGEIDRAVRDVTRRSEFELYGAGRTDAGVHALAQVAHLDLYTDLPPQTLRSRSYLYQISRRKTAFFKPYVWWIREPLDMARMREGARPFVGMQSYASFTADEPGEKSTRVLVDRLEIAEEGDLVLVRIVGSHFLWRMVRRLVGVLAAVGRRELTPAQAGGFLDERSDVPATLTAPASGLFLEGVYYRGDEGPGVMRSVANVPSNQ